MARREWTVVIVSDDDTGVRQFRFTRAALRAFSALVVMLILSLSALGTAFVIGTGSGLADEVLAVRNQLLEQELDGMTARLDTLQLSLEVLSEKDEYYRLLAGLEPVDGDVLLAGIGGPDADSLGANPLFRVDPQAGRRTFSTASHLDALIRRARVLTFSWSEAEDTLTGKHERLGATPSIYPTEGYVSSAFTSSRWHPILDRPRPHTGIDIVAPSGTPVVASAAGRVSIAQARGEYGLTVEIDHGHGTVTRYAHLSKLAVKRGDRVARGDVIGNVGQSGLAVGPHLHYEVLVNGTAADPRRYILDMNVIPD